MKSLWVFCKEKFQEITEFSENCCQSVHPYDTSARTKSVHVCFITMEYYLTTWSICEVFETEVCQPTCMSIDQMMITCTAGLCWIQAGTLVKKKGKNTSAQTQSVQQVHVCSNVHTFWKRVLKHSKYNKINNNYSSICLE